jgi:hypothetical protein
MALIPAKIIARLHGTYTSDVAELSWEWVRVSGPPRDESLAHRDVEPALPDRLLEHLRPGRATPDQLAEHGHVLDSASTWKNWRAAGKRHGPYP